MKLIVGSLTLEGDPKEVMAAATSLGYTFPPDKFYQSSSKGPIEIKSMETKHLINAVVKLYSEYLRNAAKKATTGADFMSTITKSKSIEDTPSLLPMMQELASREE